MALSTKLNEVVDMVRDEAKLSSNSSRGVDHRAHIVRLIKRQYETLGENFEWEHLMLKRDDANARVQLALGSVGPYTFPTSVKVQKITGAWLKWAGRWKPLDYGINFANWTAMDPANNERVDPITNWDFYSLTQFEVWPEPATAGAVGGNNEIAFEGQRNLTPILNEDSVLDLDDHVIALHVAAEILASNGQKTFSEVKAAAAKSRLDRLTANLGSKKRIAMGIGVIGQGRAMPRHPRFIRG